MVIYAKEMVRMTKRQKALLDKLLKVQKKRYYHEVLENVLGDYLLIMENKK